MRRVAAITLIVLMLAAVGFAQQASNFTVPNLIRYGGTLKNTQEAPIASATTGVTFAIYARQEGGAPIWMETQNVSTDASGNYSVLLGSTTATGLPNDMFSQQEQRWLGVQVQGETEQPRVLMVSVPYAFKAHDAETLGGKSASDFMPANGATPAAKSGSGSAPAAPSSANVANNPPTASGIQKGQANDGPTNFNGSTTNQIVAVTQNGTGSGLVASAPTLGIQGIASAASGTAYGVQGVAYGTAGVGLIGTATSTTGFTYGLRGTSSSTSGTGVRGIDNATSGSTVGISGYVDSASGTAGILNNAAGGNILIGQNNGVTEFTVDGSGDVSAAGVYNSATTYQVGGSNVLSIGSVADSNLFLGIGAGTQNVVGMGTGNTFTGSFAGPANTTGYDNTFTGSGAGASNTTGYENTFTGALAGNVNTTGDNNTFVGNFAGVHSTAAYNTFVGSQAGNGTNAGESGCCNTFTGYSAGAVVTTGQSDSFYGNNAGLSNTTGNNDIFVGNAAGANNTTGNNDIYIGNQGPSSGTESATVRIGAGGTQTATYIAGIYGETSSSGIPVYINSNGQLGTVTSSRRFKEQINDMGDSTSALMKLRPVSFLYKPEYSHGDPTLQYGLIAEEVAAVYPELVAYDKDGQPYTVRYQYLTPMLLNEVQKQYRRAEQQSEVVATQQAQIMSQQQEIESLKRQLQLQNAAVQERLSRLEKALGNQAQLLAQK